MKSPFAFRQHGECGRWVSSVFPEIADVRRRPGVPAGAVVEDERARAGQLHDEHRLPDARVSRAWGPGCRTGWARSPTTCRRSWCCPTRGACPTTPRATSRRASCPQSHQGTILDAGSPRPIPDLFPPASAAIPHAPRASATGWTVLERLNRRHAAANEGDSRLESRIAAYELAARMQRQCPEALDLAGETAGDARRSTASTSPSPPTSAAAACWPAGCSSAACGSSRSGAARAGRRTTGTTTATSPTSCRRSPARVDRPIAGAAARPEGPRPAGRHAGRLEHRVRPACRSPRERPAATTTAAPRSPGWPARASRAGVAYGESDPWAWKAADGPDLLLRPARDDPAPAGHRPHAADLPPQRHRPPADRRPRARHRRDPGLRVSA